MAMARRIAVVGGGVLVILVGFSAAGARFLSRHEMFGRPDAAADHIARPAHTASAAASASIEELNRALAANDVRAAELAWHDAYRASLRRPDWEPMLELGDASLRIAALSTLSRPAVAQARDAYLIALFRARRAGSVDGLLRAAAAFDKLGDRMIAEQCLRIADEIAGRTGEPSARARQTLATARTERPAVDPASIQPF